MPQAVPTRPRLRPMDPYPNPMPIRIIRILLLILTAAVIPLTLTGCVTGPTILALNQQTTLDRSRVEYPSGFELKPYVTNLTAPTAMAFDMEGSLIVAEGGFNGTDPHIFGIRHESGSIFEIYPHGQKIPFVKTGFRLYGPIGGLLAHNGRAYVSHRDSFGRGVITSLGYDGSHTTIVADLPAQGDLGVTDLAMSPNGRLYFGVGTATNSGVVGLDNWAVGWVKRHPDVCDLPWLPGAPPDTMKLYGYRFDSPNPRAGLFGGSDIVATGPFQPFGTSNESRIPRATNGKPNGAIFSVSPNGGDLRVEAYGIHYPRGLAFSNEYPILYFTNDGMEMRGTRPIKDDPDALLRMISGTFYGWPDFTADLHQVSETPYQPPLHMIIPTGYRDVSPLVDRDVSGLIAPDRNTLVRGVFASLSGASKFDFAPGSGPFKDFRGSVIIALSGDRAPFATTGKPLLGPVGYKVVRVDPDTKQVTDFVRNTVDGPASRNGNGGLERPVDIKFGPDGVMYLLDFGRLDVRNGKEKIPPHTGRIFRLVPSPQDATRPPHAN